MKDEKAEEANEAEERLLDASADLMAACNGLPLRLITSPVPEVQARKDTEVYMFNLIFLAPAKADPLIKQEIEKLLDQIYPAIEAITIIKRH